MTHSTYWQCSPHYTVLYFLELVLVTIVRLKRQVGLRDMLRKFQADQLKSDHPTTAAVIVPAPLYHTCGR